MFNIVYCIVGMLLLVQVFASSALAQIDEAALLNFISSELGIPPDQILGSDGNLTQQAEQALIARPDVLEELERIIDSGEAAQAAEEQPFSSEGNEAQMMLDDYLQWSRENNMVLDQEFIDELLSQGAVMPQATAPAESDSTEQTDNSASRKGSAAAPVLRGSENQGIPDSAILGVAYKVGELVTRYDYMTGLMIANTEGGGVYLLLKDGTALKQPPAPSDIDLNQYLQQNPSSVERLNDLDFSREHIFAPHPQGYRLDFYGEDNTPGIGGPTFRAFLLNEQGYFKESSTTLITGPEMMDGSFGRSVSSDAMSGVYHIDGNTIELQFHDGRLERRVFGTNNVDKLIIGERQYRRQDK